MHGVVHDFLIAFLAGVVATVAWTFWTDWRRKKRLDDALGWITGRYDVTLKSSPQPKPQPEKITITVEDNRLIVRIDGLEAGGRANGQIVIDERHPTSGRGFYYHERATERMFGFWDVQLRLPASILVHTTYVDNETFREVPKGYIWDRVGPPA